jgi:probable O-glycosylation ligase (exosortase A-associated)
VVLGRRSGLLRIKGGLFTLATGGNFMVNGPPESAMEGNNSLGVGMVVIIPLMYYLWQVSERRLVRVGLMVAMPLCAVSVLGSYSRGALLAILAMGALLWIRGRHKVAMAAAAVVFVLVAIPFMPDKWTARMHTIEAYEGDLSAMQRLWLGRPPTTLPRTVSPGAAGSNFNPRRCRQSTPRIPSTRTLRTVSTFRCLAASGSSGC